jgi:hypothetical protein
MAPARRSTSGQRVLRSQATMLMPTPAFQPFSELAGAPPPDIPSRGAACRQRLGDQRRLTDAGLALDPDHRAFTALESLYASTEDRELLPAAHPLRRPVNGPHASNVCPERTGPPHIPPATRSPDDNPAAKAATWCRAGLGDLYSATRSADARICTM